MQHYRRRRPAANPHVDLLVRTRYPTRSMKPLHVRRMYPSFPDELVVAEYVKGPIEFESNPAMVNGAVATVATHPGGRGTALDPWGRLGPRSAAPPEAAIGCETVLSGSVRRSTASLRPSRMSPR